MKVAYCILHYGHYFSTALEAIYPQVDKIVIAYTAGPSQGFASERGVPQTEDELRFMAEPYMDKIEWFSGNFAHEGEHCDAARAKAREFSPDWLIRFDSDEIFPEGSVDWYIAWAEDHPEYDMFRMPFLHFWRSFERVCRDGQFPIRLERPEASNLGWLDGGPEERYSVIHLGYAQPTRYIEYKMDVQAHHSEWRGDWFHNRWLANAQTDVHPVIFDFWNTEAFDKERLPAVLKKCPEFYLGVIDG